MVDEGRYILQQHGEPCLQRAGHLGALHKVRYQALLIDHILTHHHRVFLELGDVQEEFVVDVFPALDALGILGDFLGEELDHIGIKVDTLIQYRRENAESGGIETGIHLHPALKFGERAQGNFTEGYQSIVLQCERYGLHHILIGPRSKEVGVGENGAVGLEITGGAFDFLRLGAALDFYVQEGLHGPFFIPAGFYEVDPHYVCDEHGFEVLLRAGDCDPPIVLVEDADHRGALYGRKNKEKIW